MEAEFAEFAEKSCPDATLTMVLVDHAIVALKGGDQPTHDRLLAERVSEVEEFDAVTLAHFSMSLTVGAVRQQLSKPGSPHPILRSNGCAA
jgi:hypothetical protein